MNAWHVLGCIAIIGISWRVWRGDALTAWGCFVLAMIALGVATT